ncbi:MAG: M15 family metallopeptidase [Actinomycetota bacterium]|nr:M15 family metallopeptidase [Actinomycetota bacterium]
MRSTYRAGCPVALSELRYLTLSYHGFDGRRHTGELVVSATVASDVLMAFRTLYDEDFPIRSMRLVSDFDGGDNASMAADNTSAFNCRRITGGSSWSEHSYGDAVDINPRENPYLSGGSVLPPAGIKFVDRPDAPGVIHPDDLVVRAFTVIGWTWGGSWSSPVDLQHFSRSGR